jgi:hypothetical protein
MKKGGSKYVFFFLGLVVSFLYADTLTLQQGLNGFSGFSDTYIVMTTDSTPSLSPELVVEGYHCSACIDERALIRIDLSSLAKNMTIDKAELLVFSPSQPRPGSGVVEVYKVSRSWVDSEANWFNATENAKWSKAGGDVLSGSVAKLEYGTQVNVWHKLDVTKAVKDFIADPASNFGLMLRLSPAMLTVTYVSSQGPQEKRPKLVLTYPSAGVSAMPARDPLPIINIGQTKSGISFIFPKTGSRQISLTQMNGASIFNEWIKGDTYLLGIGNFANGPYVVKISGNNERFQKRIFIER